MSKEEAIQAMKEGKKVTHRFFSSDEWMTIENGFLLLEDGVRISLEDFFNFRSDSLWDNGYEFVRKLAQHGNGIALLFNRCDSKMFQDIIFEKATAIKFLRGRIRFFRPDGIRGDSPGCGAVLIAFGEENAEILKTCNISGKYVRIN